VRLTPAPPRAADWLVWAVLAAVVLAIGVRLVTAVHLGGAMRSGDFDRFYELARSGGRPYVSYAVEYPPLTLALFKGIAAFTVGRSEFGHVLVWLNVMADLGIACLLLWVWGPVAAAFYLISAMFLVHLLDARVDLLSTALTTLGVAAWARRRPAAGGTAIGLATFTKLWPAPLALLGLGRLAGGPGRERLRFTVAALAVMAAVGGGWLLVGGMHGISQVLTYRHATGWEVETIPGLFLLAIHHGEVTVQSGAFRIGSYGTLWRLFLWGTSIPLATWSALRGARVNRIGLGWVCSVGSLLVLSALLSPQFIVWILPGAAIAWVEGDRRVALLVGLCAPLTGLEMQHFGWLIEARPSWLLLVGVRDALLVAAVVLAARSLRRARPESPPSRPAEPLVDPAVLVVVPTYDEADNVAVAVGRIRAALPGGAVLVVDDDSPDGTGDIVAGLASADPAVHLLRRPGKAGLGTAYQDGFAWGMARGFDVLVEIDADLSHDPADLPRLVGAVAAGADLAIGSRYVQGGRIQGWPLRRELLSRTANRYAGALLQLPVRDATSGYRAYRSWVIAHPALSELTAEGYAFQIQAAHLAYGIGATIAEVPITFVDRVHGRSKMHGGIIVEAARVVVQAALADLHQPERRAGRPPAPAPAPSVSASADQ
jgi:dolichol-phosphate mannosyltransferase